MAEGERGYLDLLGDVLARGDRRLDRTGVGTAALFGAMLRFDMRGGRFPVLTTKRVLWKTAVREMLWFLTGGTNIQALLKDGVRIWTDWPLTRYREATGDQLPQAAFEARIVADDAFAARWGDLGPVYGKQWRRWQGPDGVTYDQISGLIKAIRDTPASRRLLFHAWNVADLGAMTLPPCHMVYQFHCTDDGGISCLLFQRSCDLFLGGPFNFVGAAALLTMIADQTGRTPSELVWVGGDVHLYSNHFAQADEMRAREPRACPTMRLTRRPSTIDGYRIEDFALSGYDPHPAIAAPVAV